MELHKHDLFQNKYIHFRHKTQKVLERGTKSSEITDGPDHGSLLQICEAATRGCYGSKLEDLGSTLRFGHSLLAEITLCLRI